MPRSRRRGASRKIQRSIKPATKSTPVLTNITQSKPSATTVLCGSNSQGRLPNTVEGNKCIRPEHIDSRIRKGFTVDCAPLQRGLSLKISRAVVRFFFPLCHTGNRYQFHGLPSRKKEPRRKTDLFSFRVLLFYPVLFRFAN